MHSSKPFERRYTARCAEAHKLALRAKYVVFEAQDCIAIASLSLPPPATGRAASSGLRRVKAVHERMRRELSKARAALEAFDRAMLGELDADNQHCDCGGYPNARPHEATCPLYDPADPPSSEAST